MLTDTAANPRTVHDYHPVFIIGAPRSGTTWLAELLACHPEIVASYETGLFSEYIAPLTRQWEKQLGRPVGGGLPAVFTEEDFTNLVQQIVASVYQRINSLKPTASIVLDKQPEYSRHVSLIRACVPSARFIHIIRDGRDVVTSLLAASRGWGRQWAPRTVTGAARVWTSRVRAAREAAQFDDDYIETRYEHLLTGGPAELMRLFAFCGVHATDNECSNIYERCSFAERSAQRSPSSLVVGGEVRQRSSDSGKLPDGFYRQGQAGGWRESLGPTELWCIDRLAGPLLRELGYAEPGWRAQSRLQDLTAALRVAPRVVMRRADRLMVALKSA